METTKTAEMEEVERLQIEKFTKLDEPIKIRWYNQESRSRLFSMSACAHIGDRSHETEPYWRGASFYCYQRQKTNIVVRYLEEARELIHDLKNDYLMGASTTCSRGGSVSQTPTMNKKYGELYQTMRDELSARGIDPDELMNQTEELEV